MSSEPLLVAYGLPVVQPGHFVRSNILYNYWTLTKPEINFLIGLATAAAFVVGNGEPLARFPWVLLVHTLLGTVLVASGAGTLNQVIERKFDAQMRRTSRRPIAAGRIEPIHALVFGMLLSLVGCTYLALAVRPAASLLAVLTLVCYLFLYTPLKRRTPMCTLVGAFPGAMPVLIGYVAAAGKLNSPAWLFCAILFLWQFPHFMAIAWMYREDYARAGYAVLPKGREKARFMGWQSVLPSLALIPTAVASLILQHANQVLVVATLLLSLSFLFFAARLAAIGSNGAARQLLLVSVVYLPLVFLLHVLTRV
jgi:protoheme IX farnesyltransferase